LREGTPEQGTGNRKISCVINCVPLLIALAEFDAYTRFKAMVVTGNPEADLRILSKLDNLTE
jgi:hypothetical protein